MKPFYLPNGKPFYFPDDWSDEQIVTAIRGMDQREVMPERGYARVAADVVVDGLHMAGSFIPTALDAMKADPVPEAAMTGQPLRRKLLSPPLAAVGDEFERRRIRTREVVAGLAGGAESSLEQLQAEAGSAVDVGLAATGSPAAHALSAMGGAGALAAGARKIKSLVGGDLAELRAEENRKRIAENRPTLEEEAEDQYLTRSARGVGEFIDKARDALKSDYSRAIEGEFAKAQQEGIGSTVEFLAENPLQSASVMAGPALAYYLGPGLVSARLARAAGASDAAATTAAVQGTGGVIALHGAEQAEESVMSADMSGNPKYLALIEQGYSDEQARRSLAKEAYDAALGTGAVVNAATGAAAQRLGLAPVEEMLATGGRKVGVGRIAGAAGAGIKEAPGEAIQGAGEQYAANVGEIAAGIRSPSDVLEGIGTSAVVEAFGGATIGAAVGFASPQRVAEEVTGKPANQADPLTQAAQDVSAIYEAARSGQFDDVSKQGQPAETQAPIAAAEPIAAPPIAQESVQATAAQTQQSVPPVDDLEAMLQSAGAEPIIAPSASPEHAAAFEAYQRERAAQVERSAAPADRVRNPMPDAMGRATELPPIKPAGDIAQPIAPPPQDVISAVSENPGRISFKDNEAVARAKLEKTFLDFGVDPHLAKTMSESDTIPTGAIRDGVTGGFDGRADSVKSGSIARAIEHVANTMEPSHYVSVDIANLGGLNKFNNDIADDANADFRALTDIMLGELRSTGADVLPMRTGGDELGYIVVNAKKEDVDAAIEMASAKALEYAKARGFDSIPSTKKGREGEFGVRFHAGVAEIVPGISVREIARRADQGINASKLGVQASVAREQTQEARAIAPVQEPERLAGAGAERNERVRQKGVRSEGQAPAASEAQPEAPVGRADSGADEGISDQGDASVNDADNQPPQPASLSDILALRAEIGWASVGGRLIRGGDVSTNMEDGADFGRSRGDVVGRTKWIAHSRIDGQGESILWRHRPMKISEAEAKAAMDKLAAGKPLTKKEQSFIDYVAQMARHYEEERIEDAERHRGGDLFPAPTEKERVDAERDRRDAERNGRLSSGRTDMLSGGGTLFAGDATQQDSAFDFDFDATGKPYPEGTIPFSRQPRTTAAGSADRQPSTLDTPATRAIQALIERVGYPSDRVVFSTSPNAAFGDDAVAAMGLDGKTEAIYINGKVHLFTDALPDPARAVWVFAHEMSGHHGIRTLLGDNYAKMMNEAGSNPLIKAIAEAIKAEADTEAESGAAGARVGLDPTLYIEEALAEYASAKLTGDMDSLYDRYPDALMAEPSVAKAESLIKRIVRAITRKTYNSGVRMTDAEVLALIANAHRASIGSAPSDGRSSSRAKQRELNAAQSRARAPDDEVSYSDMANALRTQESVLVAMAKKHGMTPVGAPSGRGHYHMFETDDGELFDVRLFKDHKQKTGGGYDPATGQRSGESYVDVWFDPETGVVTVDSDNMPQDVAKEVAGAEEFVASIVEKYDGKDIRDFKQKEAAKSSLDEAIERAGGIDEWENLPSRERLLRVDAIDDERRAARSVQSRARSPQTETKEFKRWFGDSKVVDENGEPLVVYHGTKSEFDTFDIRRLNSRNEGPGFYFTGNRDVASGYGKTMAVYLSISKPLPLNHDPFKGRIAERLVKRIAALEAKANGMDERDGFLSNFANTYSEGVENAVRAAVSAISLDETAVDQISGLVGAGVPAEIVLRAVTDITGYDGITSDGFSNQGAADWGHNPIFVAFRPEQIKSATGNRGTFDPTSQNIFQSRATDSARLTAAALRKRKSQLSSELVTQSASIEQMRAWSMRARMLIGEVSSSRDFAKDIIDARRELTAERRELLKGDREALRRYDDIRDLLALLEQKKREVRDKAVEANKILDRFERKYEGGVSGKALSLADREAVVAQLRESLDSAEQAFIAAKRIADWRSQNDAKVIKAHNRRNDILGYLASEGYQMGSFTWDGAESIKDKAASIRRRIRRVIQDKMIDVRDVQFEIERQLGRALDDTQNVYREENLMHNKIADSVDMFRQKMADPLESLIKESGMTMEAVEKYLWAAHAKERNAKIRAINPGVDDGSGMSDGDADKVLASYSREQKEKLRPISEAVEGIRRHTLNTLVDAGQLTRDQADKIISSYGAYVPLRGKHGEGEARVGGTGQGISAAGAGIKRALGRKTPPKNILAELVGDAERAIVQAGKADVGRALLRLALSYPNPDLWAVEPVELEPKFNESTGEVYLAVSGADDSESVIVKHNGKPYRVAIKHPQIVAALRNTGVEGWHNVVKYGGMLNRWLSAVFTRYNPGFVLVNLARDMFLGLTGIAAELGPGSAGAVIGNYRQAVAATYLDSRMKRGDASVADDKKTMADWVREGAESGLKTGWTSLDDMDTLQSKIENSMLSLSEIAAKRPLDVFGEAVRRSAVFTEIDHVNDAIENALRFATYAHLRKDKGWSKARAAEYAKEMTVNFNRKGMAGSIINALYLFFNAGVQGSARTLKIMQNPKVLAGLGGLLAGQATLAMTLGAVKFDEDDEETLWDKIPDWTKRRSFIIPYGFDEDGTARWFSIPMPFGFNVFPAAGGYLANFSNPAWRGRNESPVANATGYLLSSVIDSLSPIAIGEENGMLPTLLQIDAAIGQNRDDLGRRIRPSEESQKYEGARSSQVMPGTPEPFVWGAKILNRLGGGTDYKKPVVLTGWTDVSPNDLEFLFNQFAGGPGNVISGAYRAAMRDVAADDMRAFDLPVVRAVVGGARKESSEVRRFYETSDRIERAKDMLGDAYAAGGIESYRDVKEDLGPAFQSIDLKVRKRTTANGRAGAIMVDPSTGRPEFVSPDGSLLDQYRDASKTLREISAAMRQIYNDPSLDRIEKQRRMIDLQKIRGDAVERVNRTMAAYDAERGGAD